MHKYLEAPKLMFDYNLIFGLANFCTPNSTTVQRKWEEEMKTLLPIFPPPLLCRSLVYVCMYLEKVPNLVVCFLTYIPVLSHLATRPDKVRPV